MSRVDTGNWPMGGGVVAMAGPKRRQLVRLHLRVSCVSRSIYKGQGRNALRGRSHPDSDTGNTRQPAARCRRSTMILPLSPCVERLQETHHGYLLETRHTTVSPGPRDPHRQDTPDTHMLEYIVLFLSVLFWYVLTPECSSSSRGPLSPREGGGAASTSVKWP